MKFLVVGLISGVILVFFVLLLLKYFSVFRANDILLYTVGFIIFASFFFFLGKITNLF
jgi:hypothetical protein